MAGQEEQAQNSPHNTSQSRVAETKVSQVARPRSLSDAERVVRHEVKRDVRDVGQFLGEASPKAPVPSSSIAVEQQEKWMSTAQEAAPIEPEKNPMRVVEDREMVKWAAWGALLISLVTSFLLGLYSSREFGPMFEYYDLEVTQKQIAKDVGQLKYSSRLEKIQYAITHAQVQLFVRKDYDAAEFILENAKEDLKILIDALPVEKTVEPKQVLANIERVLAEVRRGPASLDLQLDKISKDLSKLKN